MAKNARFEQIWKRRKGKKNSATDGNIHELCNIYDVVRVDDEEKISKKVEQTEYVILICLFSFLSFILWIYFFL